ncbi:MAG: type II secretion system protein [Deltaproteobacteria bacterium]|nr:type II secretion system protein [Deltaproteobacteria bacterium]
MIRLLLTLQRSPKGFTLLEVMVSLTLGTLIAGAVMGVISVSLQYAQRLKETAKIQPYLEAAAREILFDPEILENASLQVGDPKNPVNVDVLVTPVPEVDPAELGNPKAGRLVRVLLRCRGRLLEFSILVPVSERL